MARNNNGGFEFRFVNNFPRVRGQLRGEIENRVRIATLLLHTKIKMKLSSGNRSGVVYRVPGTIHRRYTASAEGEAPAVLFSNLLNSISWMTTMGVTNLVTGVVSTNMDYAKRLEFGFMETDSKGRRYHMAARPFFRSTFEEEKVAILAILSRRM